MAGDWIKMRVNLATHPKVMAIAEFLADDPEYQEWSTLSGFVPSFGDGNERALRNERHAALRVTRYVTVCALLRFWGYANEHARDEFVAFMTIEDIGEVVQVPSFGRALQSVGWIECSEDPTGISLPNFAEFNAVADERQSSTKAAERQRRYRERLKASQSDVTGDVTGDVTENVTVTSRNAPREEKRREEKKDIKPSSDSFEKFWSAWPKTDRKVGKSKCAEKWAKEKLEPLTDEIVAHIEASKLLNRQWREGYEPAPITYLNQRRWEDGMPANGVPADACNPGDARYVN